MVARASPYSTLRGADDGKTRHKSGRNEGKGGISERRPASYTTTARICHARTYRGISSRPRSLEEARPVHHGRICTHIHAHRRKQQPADAHAPTAVPFRNAIIAVPTKPRSLHAISHVAPDVVSPRLVRPASAAPAHTPGPAGSLHRCGANSAKTA